MSSDYVAGQYLTADELNASFDSKVDDANAVITGPLSVAGVTTITDTTNSTSTSNGALVVAGGVGIGGALFTGAGATIGGALTSQGNTYLQGALSVSGEASVSGILSISNTTASTSATTGSAVFAGGVGISGSLYVGGSTSVVGLWAQTLSTNGNASFGGNVSILGTATIAWLDVTNNISTTGTNSARWFGAEGPYTGSGDYLGGFVMVEDIGGGWGGWYQSRAFTVQVNCPNDQAAYGGVRWTNWGEAHFAAIDAINAGGNASTSTLIAFHVGQTTMAFKFDSLGNFTAVNGGVFGGRLTVNGATDDGATALQVQGNAYLTSSGVDVDLSINGSPGHSRYIAFRTNSAERWNLGGGGDAEGGGNTGTTFEITRWNDAGSYLDAPFQISRETGQVTLTQRPTWAGGLIPFDQGNLPYAIVSQNNRTVSPVQVGPETVTAYFVSKEGIETGTVNPQGNDYGDFLVLNGWTDSTGGDINGLYVGKMTGAVGVYHYQAAYGSTNWGTARQLAYTDNQTFTGSLTFAGPSYFTGAITTIPAATGVRFGVDSGAAEVATINSGGPADGKSWRFVNYGSMFNLEAVNDAWSATARAISVVRSGVNIETLALASQGGRVLVGNSTADDGVSALQVNGNTTVAGEVVVTTSSPNPALVLNGSSTNGAVVALIDESGSNSTPNKYFRSAFGQFQMFNSAYSSSIFSIDDSGNTIAEGSLSTYGAVYAGGSGISTAYPGGGMFRVLNDIGGSWGSWNSGRTYALQIDCPNDSAAYGAIRWTHQGAENIAAIDAIEAGIPSINFHVGATTRAFIFDADGNLTATGAVKSSATGFIFPDGTTQTTAAGQGGLPPNIVATSGGLTIDNQSATSGAYLTINPSSTASALSPAVLTVADNNTNGGVTITGNNYNSGYGGQITINGNNGGIGLYGADPNNNGGAELDVGNYEYGISLQTAPGGNTNQPAILVYSSGAQLVSLGADGNNNGNLYLNSKGNNNSYSALQFDNDAGNPQLFMRSQQLGDINIGFDVNGNPMVSSTNANGTPAGSFSSGKNRLINAMGYVNQRGNTTFPVNVTGYGGPDRWLVDQTNSGSSIAQLQSSLTVNGIAQNCIAQIVTTPATSVSGSSVVSGFYQNIEGYNSFDLLGKPITFSGWFASSVAGTFSVAISIYNSSGATLGSFVTSFNCPSANVATFVSVTTPPLPASWAITANSNKAMSVWIGAQNTGTYMCPSGSLNQWTTNNYIMAQGATIWASTANVMIYLTEAQLESGSVATGFEFRHIQTEVALCQRYYCQGQLVMQSAGVGPFTFPQSFPTNMRAAPTVAFGAGSLSNAVDLSVNAATYTQFYAQLGVTASGGYANYAWTASAEI